MSSFLHSIREALRIPDLWCLDCEKTIKTEDEYKSHLEKFPEHRVTTK